MPSDHRGMLVEEYHSCNEQVSRLDSLIWQTASIILPITLAGFAYFGLSTSHTLEHFFILLTVAAGSTTLLVAWYLLSRAWYAYQWVAFYRMREIETELGLWHYRYSFYIRQSRSKRKAMLNQMSDDEEIRFRKVAKQLGGLPRFGARAITRVITAIFLVGWIVLVVREIFLVF